jgi:hypothetical protein
MKYIFSNWMEGLGETGGLFWNSYTYYFQSACVSEDLSSCDLLYNPSSDLSSPAAGLSLRLTPNPASNQIILSGLTEPSAVTILNATGTAVIRAVELPRDDAKIDVSTLPPGVYWVKIAGYGSTRLVIVR